MLSEDDVTDFSASLLTTTDIVSPDLTLPLFEEEICAAMEMFEEEYSSDALGAEVFEESLICAAMEMLASIEVVS